MPANYAHYRFGAAMMDKMPGDIRRTVKRYRRLYDVGLHGPDIFYYFAPGVSTKVGKLGDKFHEQTGREFFARVCRGLRLKPSEAGFSYLYGVLSHYCLDSICHKWVQEKEEEENIPHLVMEGEFDRYLLELDGKTPAYCQDLSPHIRLIAQEYAVVASFYPGADEKRTAFAVKNMARMTKLVATPEGLRRTALKKTVSTVAQSYLNIFIPERPTPGYEKIDKELMEKYRQALELAPELLEQIGAHLTYNAPLGEAFSATFNG